MVNKKRYYFFFVTYLKNNKPVDSEVFEASTTKNAIMTAKRLLKKYKGYYKGKGVDAFTVQRIVRTKWSVKNSGKRYKIKIK